MNGSSSASCTPEEDAMLVFLLSEVWEFTISSLIRFLEPAVLRLETRTEEDAFLPVKLSILYIYCWFVIEVRFEINFVTINIHCFYLMN